MVDPGLDGEDVFAELGDGEVGEPEVVVDGGEGGGVPIALGRVAVEEACGDVVVAVGEDGGGDGDDVADDALGGGSGLRRWRVGSLR